MDKIDVDGITIAHELIGKAGDPAVALTPGGRFCMDVPGLRELAENIAAGGRRVLICPTAAIPTRCCAARANRKPRPRRWAG